MKRISATLLAGVAIALAAGPAASAADRLDVYVGEVPRERLSDIVALGVDRHELELKAVGDQRDKNAKVRVEVIVSGDQAADLRKQGIDLEPKRVDGQTAAQRAAAQAQAGMEVFRTYAGPDGLKAEFEQMARDNRKLAELQSYGRTVNGQEIVALKVTKNARSERDGKRPAVLYLGAQHAREWITPEMVRRLAHHFLDNYDNDREIRELVDENELWFVPVANPDGYDFTFTEGQRLWRKNLRDNNGDGTIAPGDGVDLNRNYAYKFGYDNEGSSPDAASETYRGPGPNSEPETKALDAFSKRVGFEFFVNYHSAAQLLLYGTGWQVATPTPDDVIAEAMAGDDAEPAVPGYDPDIAAELYTTNGDTDTHMTERYGTFGFTPEMSTCEAASESVPDDEWEAEDCGSGFEFPDDEGLVQAEFEKNIPFALSVADSADDPDDPESAIGREADNFRVDTFDVSYGDPQTVAVVAKRELDDLRMHYRVDGGRTHTESVREWRGGERYGDENDRYYAEYRGQVRGADRGDDVSVWFSGEEERRGRDRDVESERFTYTVEKDTRDDVLVIANEDYTGVNPTYPAGTDAPKYADMHVEALDAAGYDADVWDVDAQGIPHDLGVLGHYDAVLWYTGENRITQDPEDELISTPFGQLRDVGVAERQQYLTLAVRDYLNGGGKLIHAGESAQHQGLLGITDIVGGLFYGLNGDETAECVISSVEGFFEDCLILADDFRQYWLGGFARVDVPSPESVIGIDDPIEGYEGDFGGPVTEGDNPLDEAGVYQPTSEALPVEEFPQFASRPAADYLVGSNPPFSPVEGERYAGALHADESYTRLTRTVDLTAATSAELAFQLSLNIEPGYDHVIVEARTAGGDDWTTLPDLEGGTTNAVPQECVGNGFLLTVHPHLRHYLGGTGTQPCTATGSTGSWNAFNDATAGWQQARFDLSAFAGRQVEVSIAYVTDPSTGGVGAFVDDTRLTVNGTTTADGFEGETSSWAVTGPPQGSPPNSTEWEISEKLINFYAGTSTRDTLLLGFGVEQLATEAERADLLRRALRGLR
ncbi:MAG TPA: M14 family zinc carboxypeptidase [Solirubrobacteraceae bacterium]|nr:M14 family zinc carboxypeptidase [Solirubrobacteraceae bacterium]